MCLLPLLTWGWGAPAVAQQPDAGPDSPEPDAPAELPIVEGPSIVEYVEAPYPPEALEQGLEASVVLIIELDEAGEVGSVEVKDSVGNGFDEAAVDAILDMVWSPARTEAGPVPVVFEFEYGFVLSEEVPETPAELPINVEGQLIEMATRNPIAGAQVVVVDTELIAETDDEGRFTLRGVPPGVQTLRLLHVGHVPDDKPVEVVDGEVSVVKLWMRAEAYRDNEVVATYQREKDEVTRRTITIEEIRRVPGTFGDPLKVIQTLPGAARTPFGTGFLIIRGADPEDSGVYIDGIRVPIIYHLTGTTSVLSPELIEAVDYLPGGYGVQYGRTMGGTVDVRTRTEFSETPKIVWGTDILDSQIYFEGQLGKNKQHGLAVGARRSYIDVFLPLVTANTGFTLKPRYWDYQVKYMPDLPSKQRLSFFLYGFDDVLEVGTPDDVAQGADQDTQGDLSVQYSSHRLLMNYRDEVSDDLTVDLTPSFGIDGFSSGLGAEFGLGSTQYLSQMRGQLTYELSPEVDVVPGIDLLAASYRFEFNSAVQFEAIDDPLAEREPVGFDGRGLYVSPDIFLKAPIRPLEGGSDRWLITPGLRYNATMIRSQGEVAGEEPLPWFTTVSMDPRILTRYAITDEVLWVKAATGLNHQPPQPQESIGIGGQSTTGYERAWSTSMGIEHRVSPAIHWDLDLFYRKMSQLVIFNEAWTGFGDSPFLNGGDGRAYGMEVIARHDPTGRFFGWVSYTLSRASRRDSETCAGVDVPDAPSNNDLVGVGPCWFLFDFDQTHIFSAQAGYDLPRDFGVSAQIQYVTGNPASEFNAGVYDADSDFYSGFRIGGENADRLPPFFQSSLRFDKLFTFKRWQLETYVDLLNVVRGVNPEFTVYNYDFSEAAYVRGLPFIPNLGIEAKFFP